MSHSSSSTRKSEKGFSESDLAFFLKKGNTLASQRTGDTIKNYKPEEKERVTITTNKSADPVAKAFGASDEGKKVRQEGFLGPFAKISKNELERISSSFLRREREIKQRRSAAGASGLFFGRQ